MALCETGLTRMKTPLYSPRSNRRKQELQSQNRLNQRRLRKITEEPDVNVRSVAVPTPYLCLTMTSSPFSIILQILTGLRPSWQILPPGGGLSPPTTREEVALDCHQDWVQKCPGFLALPGEGHTSGQDTGARLL